MWLAMMCLVGFIGYLFWKEIPKEERKQTYFPEQTKIEPPNYRNSDPRVSWATNSCRNCAQGTDHPAGYYCKKYCVVMRGEGAGFDYVCDDYDDNSIFLRIKKHE